jgi:hypothetical protein
MNRVTEKMRQLSSNNSGVALVMALIISAIALGVMAGMIHMITGGTQMSGIQKRYNTALEAANGGMDFIIEIITQKDKTTPPINDSINNLINDLIQIGNNAVYTTTVTCVPSSSEECARFVRGDLSNYTRLKTKLEIPTSCWSGCNDSPKIDHGNSATYDINLSLGDAPLEYNTFAKIVDTVEGNTGGDEGLLNCGVVCSNPGLINVMRIPYLYSIGVDSVNSSNEAERARLAVMYQY